MFNGFPKKLNLPTWTPDFSCEFEYNITVPLGFYGADGSPGHNTGGPSPGCGVDASDADDELTVIGFQYDRPVYLGKPWQGDAEERDSSLFGLLEEYESAVFNDVDTSRLTKTGNENAQEALWRTLCVGTQPGSQDTRHRTTTVISTCKSPGATSVLATGTRCHLPATISTNSSA